MTPAPQVVTPVAKVSAEPRAEQLLPQWEDMEMQRDIAFKIVYFFIFFIVLTFGLLYAYYKIDKKTQEEEERQKRAKGIFYGESNQKTFFDFLAGQVDDENFCVNPNARQFSSAMLPKKEVG